MKTEAPWQTVGQKPHHGLLAPLSALRSQNSSGVGEFLDLKQLIDFCKEVHFDTLQLLPISDTGQDVSPYNSVSSCALDPVYLSLWALPNVDLTEIAPFKEMNASLQVALHTVKQLKQRYLYRYYQKNFTETPEYKAFYAEHEHWLTPYAQFKSLSNQFHHLQWSSWEKPYPETPDAEFFIFLQFLCFSQMQEVRAYATEQGCFLKGDIPILVSSDSADVWAEPELFHLNFIAGAPPDAYNAQGQKWCFPIFNWDTMREKRFAWWKRRLHVAESLYHIYRMDHVVGLFRIWAVPNDKSAIEGHFIPQDERLWEHQGREILQMLLDATSMLPIAEDLGTIPHMVPHVLKELGICGTKVVRWQTRWHNHKKEMIPFSEYEPLSMTTISTQDSETLQMWWENAPDEAKLWAEQKHWVYHPKLSPNERFALLQDAHHSSSYFHINLLQEYLALFPELVHEDPMQERINIPGTILPTNWVYRFRPSLEELLAHEPLQDKMRELIPIPENKILI